MFEAGLYTLECFALSDPHDERAELTGLEITLNIKFKYKKNQH